MFKGDVFIKGNISHKWFDDLLEGMQWEGSVYGTIIDGSLTVEGDIIDDNYLVLGVSGNVSCRYLFSKNGRIIIKGNLFATYGIYGEYNDGMLKLGGTLDTPYIFANDHDMPRKSDVGECIYLEAGENSEKDYIFIGQEEGSGWGWNWHYFENSDLMLKDSVFNNDELYEQLSVKKFFELVRKNENPFVDFATFENKKIAWEQENAEGLAEESSDDVEVNNESIARLLYLEDFNGNDEQFYQYIVDEYEAIEKTADENEKYAFDGKCFKFSWVISKIVENWQLIMERYTVEQADTIRKICIKCGTDIAYYFLKIGDEKRLGFLYNFLNDELVNIEKDEPDFYLALVKLGLKLEKYDEIYPLLFQFDSKAEVLPDYVAVLREFIADEGYQNWKNTQRR